MYVTKETIANALYDLITEIDKGLRAARDASVMVRLPESIQIDGEFLIQPNAIDDVTVREEVSPAIQTTEIRNTPVTVETSIEERQGATTTSTSQEQRPEVVTVRQASRGQMKTTETYTPPTDTQTTTTQGTDWRKVDEVTTKT